MPVNPRAITADAARAVIGQDHPAARAVSVRIIRRRIADGGNAVHGSDVLRAHPCGHRSARAFGGAGIFRAAFPIAPGAEINAAQLNAS